MRLPRPGHALVLVDQGGDGRLRDPAHRQPARPRAAHQPGRLARAEEGAGDDVRRDAAEARGDGGPEQAAHF